MDTYGSLNLPIVAVAGTPLVLPPAALSADALAAWNQDPFVHYLLSYLATVIHARLGAAWVAIHPVDGRPVRGAFTNDPMDSFNDKAAPALYVYRSGEPRHEQIATDWRLATSEVVIKYVMPSAKQNETIVRSHFPNALMKLIDVAVELGRDPSWIVGADTEPRAVRDGSYLYSFAKCYSCRALGWRRVPLVIQTKDEALSTMRYPSWELTLEVRERVQFDRARYPSLVGVNVTQKTADAGYGDDGIVLNEIVLEK